MFQNFAQVIEAARGTGRRTAAVAAAQDPEVIEAVRMAGEMGLVDAILVGDAQRIRPLAEAAGLPPETRILDEPDTDQAALKAAALVHDGQAQVLVKGLINSSNFLRAALNPERGLRTGRILSHLAMLEIPGVERLAFLTDGGVNIAPGLEEKRQILYNAVEALNKMGFARPNAAVLTANELVNPKMPATVDAKALVDLWQAGAFPPCLVEGPVTMDVAASRAAAEHKGIASQVAGQVDIFLVPDIEAGNLVAKTLIFYAKAKLAGVILGAARPIVLVSRADNAEAKANSIALASLLAG